MKEDKEIEQIPEHFETIEEASNFWDTHDAGDYEEYLRPLNEKNRYSRRGSSICSTGIFLS